MTAPIERGNKRLRPTCSERGPGLKMPSPIQRDKNGPQNQGRIQGFPGGSRSVGWIRIAARGTAQKREIAHSGSGKRRLCRNIEASSSGQLTAFRPGHGQYGDCTLLIADLESIDHGFTAIPPSVGGDCAMRRTIKPSAVPLRVRSSRE